MNTEQFNILYSYFAGELYRRLRYALNSTNNLILFQYKKYIDLIIEIIHCKAHPIFVAMVNTEYIEGKISLDDAVLKLDYFQKIYNI